MNADTRAVLEDKNILDDGEFHQCDVIKPVFEAEAQLMTWFREFVVIFQNTGTIEEDCEVG